MVEQTDTQSRILIVGGYGHVGSQIASRLLKGGKRDVWLAGRDEAKAEAMAKRLGCRAVQLDLRRADHWDQALAGIKTVVVCVDQTDSRFAEHVLRSGRHYLDITADDGFFRKVELLGPMAKTTGGTALLSVGLTPGLTNLMVKACANSLQTVTQARIGILLGLGDTHGPAAIDWTLRNFKSAPIELMQFGGSNRQHPAIAFDFADQHVLRRTLGIEDVRTLMTFDSPTLSRLLFRTLPIIVKHAALRRLFSKSMMHIRLGSDRAALSVEVKGTRDGMTNRRTMQLEGKEEAAITALIAAETIHLLHDGSMPAGVWHIDQVISIDHYRKCLSAEGISIL